MTEFDTLAHAYVDAWNEADPARRRALIARGWTKGATYVDPMMRGQGHAEIDALMAGVQARFPGLSFRLTAAADGYGDRCRFSWEFGPPGADSVVEGTDFAVIEAGRLASVTGFLDKAPSVV